MKQRSIRALALVLVLACLAAGSLFAQDYKGLLGKWSMVSETDGDPVNWTLVLKDANGQLAAFLATDGDEQPAKDFTYADGVLKFKAPYQGEEYDIEVKPVAGKLAGTWTGGGSSGNTSGTRSGS